MNEEFKIEKGVALPRARGGTVKRYPWREMEIGDSIFIPCENGETPAQVMMRLGGSLAYARPFVFTRRRMPDGVRVWRIQ